MRTKSEMHVLEGKAQAVKKAQFKDSSSTKMKRAQKISSRSDIEEGEVVEAGDRKSRKGKGKQSKENQNSVDESSIENVYVPLFSPTAGETEKTVSWPEPEACQDPDVNTQGWPDLDEGVCRQPTEIFDNNGILVSVQGDPACGFSRTYSEEELDNMQSLPV